MQRFILEKTACAGSFWLDLPSEVSCGRADFWRHTHTKRLLALCSHQERLFQLHSRERGNYDTLDSTAWVQILPLLMTKWSILNTPLNKGLLSKVTDWLIVLLQLSFNYYGVLIESRWWENSNTEVQKVYLDFCTVWFRYDEPPELIRDYNTTQILFLQVVKGAEGGLRFDSLRWRFFSCYPGKTIQGRGAHLHTMCCQSKY